MNILHPDLSFRTESCQCGEMGACAAYREQFSPTESSLICRVGTERNRFSISKFVLRKYISFHVAGRNLSLPRPGGQFAPEQVAGIKRNNRPKCIGMSGRIHRNLQLAFTTVLCMPWACSTAPLAVIAPPAWHRAALTSFWMFDIKFLRRPAASPTVFYWRNWLIQSG